MEDFFRLEREPRSSLRNHVACVWMERSTRSAPLLPDAAVELVWSGRGLFVRGADTRPHQIDAFPERTFVAVRFRPGAAAGVLGLRGRDLADARVGVSELWGRAEMERLESRIAACATVYEAAAALEDVVAARVRDLPDLAVTAAVSALHERGVLVRELADAIGLSERQLRRRCVDALGYGPKMLDRILRLQRFRLLLRRRPELGLAGLAVAAGYADQPHLTRECVRLAGKTPAAMIA